MPRFEHNCALVVKVGERSVAMRRRVVPLRMREHNLRVHKQEKRKSRRNTLFATICSARRGCQQTLNVCLLPIFSSDFNCLYPWHLNSRFPSRERIIQRMLDISQNIFFLSMSLLRCYLLVVHIMEFQTNKKRRVIVPTN